MTKQETIREIVEAERPKGISTQGVCSALGIDPKLEQNRLNTRAHLQKLYEKNRIAKNGIGLWVSNTTGREKHHEL